MDYIFECIKYCFRRADVYMETVGRMRNNADFLVGVCGIITIILLIITIFVAIRLIFFAVNIEDSKNKKDEWKKFLKSEEGISIVGTYIFYIIAMSICLLIYFLTK